MIFKEDYILNYGRHQTFYLKKNWINKSMNAIAHQGDELFFASVNNYLELGIGKNMFQSLVYWLKATSIMNQNYELTQFGEFILTNDRAVELNFSLNILHYNLVSSREDKDDRNQSFYWFFNEFNEPFFTKEQMLEKLIAWSKVEENKTISENTLKKDVDCIISMYLPKKIEHPEDKNISLLSSLGLIEQDHKIYFKQGINFEKISKSAFLYIIHLLANGNEYIALDDVFEGEDGIGKVFCMSRNEMIELIEILQASNYPIALTRTNGLDTIVIKTNMNAAEYFYMVINNEVKGDVYEV